MTSKPAPTVDNRILPLGLLMAVCLLGFALRLYQLDADSLWIDEISTATRVLLDPSSLLRALPSFGVGVELPLIYLVARPFLLLFGDSEFILRMPAVLFGALSVPLAYKVGTLLWTRQEGLIAALLLSVNAYHVSYSQEARHYALLVFLALLSLVFLLKALRENRIGVWAGFALCTTLSLYTHYFAFLFVAAEVAFGAGVLLWDRMPLAARWRPVELTNSAHGTRSLSRPVVRFSVTCALIALAYLPWLPALQALLASQTGSELAGASPASVNSSLNFLGEVVVAFTGAGGAALLLYTALAFVGLAAAGWQASALALLWMGIPFGFFALVGSEHPLHPRYVLFVLPVFLLAVARGAASAARIFDRRMWAIKSGGVAALGIMAGFASIYVLTSVAPLEEYYSGLKEDWRSAAHYLADNAHPGDLVLADGRQRGWGDALRVNRGLSYYLPRYGAAELPVLPAERGIWRQLELSVASEGEVRAVLWYPGRLKVGDLATVEHFHQIAVLRLREPSGDITQDAVSMLRILLDVLPGEAAFDLRLALAEIHEHTANCEQASLHLQRALESKPGDAQASEDLSEAVAEWEDACPGLPVP
jgi:mannosyltransferase